MRADRTTPRGRRAERSVVSTVARLVRGRPSSGLARCPRCRRALLALGAVVLVAGCSSSAASDGAVPLDELHGSSTSTAATEAAAPDPTADRGPAGSGPAGTDPVVAAVADVLGGQASISRPVGDDGSRPEVRDDRVFILGDSIVESAGPSYYDTIRQQLVPLGWKPTIDAQQGRTTPEGLRVLQQAPPRRARRRRRPARPQRRRRPDRLPGAHRRHRRASWPTSRSSSC